MGTSSLIVELVLTGGLWMISLLIPAIGKDFFPMDLSMEVGAVLLGTAFVFGVVLDRASDNVIARWEALIRCDCFKKGSDRIPSPLKEMIEEERIIEDPFPEGWMRTTVMTGADGIVEWLNQLRVRTRIARSLAIAIPAIACSAAWTVVFTLERKPGGNFSPFLAPSLSLLLLVILSFCVSLDWFKRVYSVKVLKEDPKVTWSLWWLSPPVIWFAAHLAAGAAALAFAGNSFNATLVILILGILLTALSLGSWWSIIKTYHAYLWQASSILNPAGLMREITNSRGMDHQQPERSKPREKAGRP